ncbi:hypothetical protein Brsp01_47500 [Brucella sp. NBRC 12950]|nr:hypothetical protein Brsp01_47500 [Brucella sp. NBRC 12950]
MVRHDLGLHGDLTTVIITIYLSVYFEIYMTNTVINLLLYRVAMKLWKIEVYKTTAISIAYSIKFHKHTIRGRRFSFVQKGKFVYYKYVKTQIPIGCVWNKIA